MKKTIFILSMLASGIIFSQTGRVGINTESPKTTLDVTGKTDNTGVSLTTDITGLQAPRLTREELTNKGNSLYGTDQKGALIYISNISGGDANLQRVNITSIGYYYFDGAIWQKINSGNIANTEPWFDQATQTPATGNTQNIYQIGNVAINKIANYAGAVLDVEGAVRGGANQQGTVGANSVAFGLNNQAEGNSSFASGISNQSNTVGSFTTGFGNITSSQYEVAIGRWNAITTGGNSSSFTVTDPAFQIGASATSSTRRNAFVVLKNGNTGIAIPGAEAAAKPTEMLDVGAGNVRVRDINSSVGTAATDKIVVADANGVLKTIPKQNALLFGGDLIDAVSTTSTSEPALSSAGVTTNLRTVNFSLDYPSLVTFDYTLSYSIPNLGTLSDGYVRRISGGLFFSTSATPTVPTNLSFAFNSEPLTVMNSNGNIPGFYYFTGSQTLKLNAGTYAITLFGSVRNSGQSTVPFSVDFGASPSDSITITAKAIQ